MDIQYLIMLRHLREALGGSLNTFFTIITTFAVDYYVVIPALILYWCVDKKKGLRVLGGYSCAIYLNPILKSTFCAYRPWIRSDQVQPLAEAVPGATGYSFPSGHSTSASSFYGGLIYQYRKHKALCGCFAAMILLTMFSRNFVGVHTPQDVVVGCLLGIIGVLIANKLFDLADAHKNADLYIWLGAAVATVAALCYVSLKSYPRDYVDGVLLVDPDKMIVDSFIHPGTFFGIITGWFLERRFVHFEIKGTAAQKVTRAFIGGLLYALYYTAVMSYVAKLIGHGMAHFALQASGPILFMVVYPMIFTRLQKAE